ncbi:hypothetical protein B0J14DRAFT_560159 [Halenospora varia]|nr:hypothetical protein B0J14DRAFT_560159 [Halenospora varia]
MPIHHLPCVVLTAANSQSLGMRGYHSILWWFLIQKKAGQLEDLAVTQTGYQRGDHNHLSSLEGFQIQRSHNRVLEWFGNNVRTLEIRKRRSATDINISWEALRICSTTIRRQRLLREYKSTATTVIEGKKQVKSSSTRKVSHVLPLIQQYIYIPKVIAGNSREKVFGERTSGKEEYDQRLW